MAIACGIYIYRVRRHISDLAIDYFFFFVNPIKDLRNSTFYVCLISFTCIILIVIFIHDHLSQIIILSVYNCMALSAFLIFQFDNIFNF